MLEAHLGKLRLKSLQILLLARELGSLRAVAEAVNTSQPAVTQTLQELEKTFGQTLLTRDHSGVALTDAGVLLATRAKVALAEMAIAAESLQGAVQLPILRLGVLPFLMFELVPSTLHQLANDANPLRVRIHETFVQRLKDRLLAGDDDLVLTRLGALSVDAPEFASIRIHPIATEPVSFFVGERHPLYPLARRGQSIDPAQLAGCAWVLPTADTDLRRQVDELLVLSGLAPSTPWVEAGSLHSMLFMVSTTNAISAVPEAAIRRVAEVLKLAPLKLSRIKPTSIRIVAMYHARQDYNPSIPVILESLAKAVSASKTI